MNLNKVMVMGRLCRDPELRVTPKGTPICQFSLAINREFKMESGEKREEVVYVDVEAWGKQGETIAKYLVKGRPLYVEGRLRLDQWEDKNTKEKRSRMKIVMEQFQFIGGKEESPANQNAERHQPPERKDQLPRSSEPTKTEDLDSDVPF